MSSRFASCSCGQLQAQVSGEPLRISICHCLACQRRSGSVFATQARFASENVVTRGESRQFRRAGDEGPGAIFHFCPHCGVTVYYETVGVPEQIAIPIGVFADPDFPAPRVSVYESRRHAWVQVPEDVEHYD
ncbi:MAG: GFA family protein [Lysobacterales bacterium]